MVLVYMKDGCGQGRERRRRVVRKVSRGDYKSLSGRHVPSPMSSLTALRMPGYFVACPVDAICVGPISAPFSHSRGIVPHLPSSCTVRFSFSRHPVGYRPHALFLVPDPPFPLPSFLFWGHGRPHASLIERTLSPLLYSPLRSLA